MKKKLSAFLLGAVFLGLIPFCGCSPSIQLETYQTPQEIHSVKQMEYLFSGDPASLDSEIDGKHEYSRPEPVTLRWSDKSKGASYVVEVSEKEDFSEKLTYTAKNTNAKIYNLKIATKYFWRVKHADKGNYSATGTFSTVDYGPRNLYVDGVTNVRDTGGWKTKDGGRVKQGLLYRSGRLNNSYPEGWVKGGDDTGYEFEAEITAEGARVMKEELKIRTEIDFRTRDRNGYPGTTDEDETLFSAVDGVNYLSVPMDGSADINANKAAIKVVFEILSDESNYPIVYHCNIGTDRTGMVAFLLNALCGVEEEDLYFDYMFSDFGTIALPSPQVSNPERKELTDLTGTKGAAGRVKAYAGNTLAEKAENCLKDCGIDEETYLRVKSILTQ